MKHLYHPKKFSKSLKLVFDLIKEYFDFFDGNTLFNAFDAVMRYDKKFEAKEDRVIIKKLYLFLIELSYNVFRIAKESFGLVLHSILFYKTTCTLMILSR